MEEIALFTMGTRGDVQPYIYLAQALQKSGIKTIIGSHSYWKELVESAGVAFAPIGPDIDIDKEAAIIRGKTKHPALSMLKTMQFMFRIIQKSSPDIYEVCKGKKLIVISHSQMGAVEAEVLGIPTINVTLQTEMIPEKLKEKTWKDKVIGGLIDVQIVKPYNKIRRQYSFPMIKSMDALRSKRLNIIPISRYVKEKNPYWEDHYKLTGYWYLEEKAYQPDEMLKRFLEAGEKPIILSLGAMSFEEKQEKEKLSMFINAFQKTGFRAIIQGFQKTLEDYSLPNTMLAIGSVPHSWLFKEGYCIMHHCGFGTASSSMIYGTPSIPIPHALDQFGVAKQLYELGVAVQPVKASALSEEKLVKAIEEMKKNYEEKKQRVRELSAKMQEENGLEKSVEMIKEILRACS